MSFEDVSDILRPKEHSHLLCPEQRSCLSHFGRCSGSKDILALLGWGFDYLCELLACADAATNVLVGVQLLRDGHTTWGWTVLGFTINASVVYTFMLVQTMRNACRDGKLGDWLNRRSKATLFLLFLPFAHILMIAYWFLTTFVHPESSDDVLPVDLSQVATTRAAKEEAAAVERSAMLMGRIAQGLKRQESTYILLFTEALAEALPQAVVQLLALSLIGSATTLQIVSLCVSVMALLTKSTYLCLSCDLRVFAFKLLVIAHDTFSLLYVVTTLLSREDPHRTEEFVGGSGIYVSPLGFAWLAKEASVAVLAVVYALGLVAILLGAHFLRVPGMDIDCDDFKYALLVSACVLFCFLPGLALLEAFKLSLIVLLVWMMEPRSRAATHAAVLFAFCNHGNDATCSSGDVWRGKMKHLYYETAQSQKSANKPWRYYVDYTTITEKVMGVHPTVAKTDVFGQTIAPLDPVSETEREAYFCHKELAKLSLSITPPFDYVRLKPLQRAGLWLVIVPVALSALLSLSFPFVNVALYPRNQSVPQLAFIGGVLACLLAMAFLLPAFIRYVQFCLECDYVLKCGPGSFYDSFDNSFDRSATEWVVNAIASYHHPSPCEVLGAIVGERLVPRDVTTVVAEFLTKADIVVNEMTIAECEKFHEECD